MKLAIALAIAAAPALAQEQSEPFLGAGCMEIIGPAVYGPENFESGVTMGVVVGYAFANGSDDATSSAAAAKVAQACRENMNLTFGQALAVLDQPD